MLAGLGCRPAHVAATSAVAAEVPVADGRIIDSSYAAVSGTLHGRPMIFAVDLGESVNTIHTAVLDSLGIPHTPAQSRANWQQMFLSGTGEPVRYVEFDTVTLGTSVLLHVQALHGNFADENTGVDGNLGGVLTLHYDFEFDLPTQHVRLYAWPAQPATTGDRPHPRVVPCGVHKEQTVLLALSPMGETNGI